MLRDYEPSDGPSSQALLESKMDPGIRTQRVALGGGVADPVGPGGGGAAVVGELDDVEHVQQLVIAERDRLARATVQNRCKCRKYCE